MDDLTSRALELQHAAHELMYLGGMNKHQITDYWNFATLTAIFQLRNDKTRGKIIVKLQMLFRFKSVQRFPDCEFLLVTGASRKPTSLLLSHLDLFPRMN